jgi:hypothetical protein
MIRWLSREGRPRTVRVTGTPLAVRVVDVPAFEVPPRPEVPHPDSPPPLWWSAPMAVYGKRQLEDDPCGGPPLARSREVAR